MSVDHVRLLHDAEARASQALGELDALGVEATLKDTDSFVRTVSALGPRTHYKHFDSACHEQAGLLHQQHGPQAVKAWLSLALWQALSRTLASDRLLKLPERIQRHQIRQYERLLSLQASDCAWESPDSDVYQKDFGLASLRLYAGAAQLIDPRCGIARSVLWHNGLSHFKPALRMALDLRGFSPMFQIHTHISYLEEFNEAGWNECYRCCADLYQLHPESLGMFGGSWFYDPALESISPRLTYLAAIPCSGGAHRVLLEKSGDFVNDAIATSPSRRKLYESGQYQPRSFLLAWSRQAQQNWAIANATEIA